MLYADWDRETNKFFQKPRSTKLKAVSTAFQAYERAPAPGTVRALENALSEWKLSKFKAATDAEEQKNWADSRFFQIVSQLSDWLDGELETHRVVPQPETGWGLLHNCYAYAMKCNNPDGTGGHALPGGAAGKCVRPSMAPYHTNLIAGVIADGAAQGKTITSLQRGAHSPVPDTRGATYLVAMVAKHDGFHFLRRDEASGRWSHKNGPGSQPETYIYNNAVEKNQILTDDVIEDLFTNISTLQYISGINTMQFLCYFLVPLSGIWVATNTGLQGLTKNYVTW